MSMISQTAGEPIIPKALTAALAAWEYLMLFPDEVQILKGKTLRNRPNLPETLALALRQNLAIAAIALSVLDFSHGFTTRAGCVLSTVGAVSSPFFVQVARTAVMIYLALLFQSRSSAPSKAVRMATYVTLGCTAVGQIGLYAAYAFWLQPLLGATWVPIVVGGACVAPEGHMRPGPDSVRKVLVSANAVSMLFDLICLACVALPLLRLQGTRAKLSALWPGHPHGVFAFLVVLILHAIGTGISTSPKVWPYTISLVVQAVLVCRVLLNELSLQRLQQNAAKHQPSYDTLVPSGSASKASEPVKTPEHESKA